MVGPIAIRALVTHAERPPSTSSTKKPSSNEEIETKAKASFAMTPFLRPQPDPVFPRYSDRSSDSTRGYSGGRDVQMNSHRQLPRPPELLLDRWILRVIRSAGAHSSRMHRHGVSAPTRARGVSHVRKASRALVRAGPFNVGCCPQQQTFLFAPLTAEMCQRRTHAR